MKSEYYIPKVLPGEKERPSIIVDAEKLYALLLRAELMMNKADRIRYATRAINQIQDVMFEFVLAYDFEEDRLYHLKKMWAYIAIFIRTMRIIGQCNAIRIQPRYETMTPDQMKIELMNAIASMDEGAASWKRSLAKKQGTRARSAAEAGTDSHPMNKGDGTCGKPAS